MASASNQPPAGGDRVVLRLPAGEVQLTRRDGLQIRDAMVAYLAATPSVRELPQFTPESAAWMREADEVEVDAGTMRIGAWIVQARGEHVVLTHRSPPTGSVGYQYVATLARTRQGWGVAKLSWEKVFFGR